MLARVANNLFWMGRYIERSEHLARFLSVNYFSSLDAPDELSQSRQFVLRSAMYMSANEIIDADITLEEEGVLFNVGLNLEQPYSIINTFINAHENARSSRDLISTELFEGINRINHNLKDYPIEKFVKSGLYEFTTMVTQSTAEVRSKIKGTLLHDEVYAIIMLGVNLERAIQVSRIINSKLSDAAAAKVIYGDDSDGSYQWSTLLKCVSTYDMMRRFYKKTPSRKSSLEFIILNEECPRSIKNCLTQIYKYICIISKNREIKNDSAAFLIGKMKSDFEYKLITDIEDDMEVFIADLIEKLVLIAEKLEDNYFDISDSIAAIEEVVKEKPKTKLQKQKQ
ncbi:alpha-E domain-containing protein [Polaribacter sp. Z014]|uniref:alpha-E domain-containing protein n=1 Tax=unclassified Polaribacter TaxID=196858 RepID=UPI00193B52C8|nr:MULTISPECIES: alpha-E domain-containing protein [unclassified Polaribacter]MCL7762758.1 alpha-E domain-containing protein [Polaribacter sp. Z014]QVY66237.1 alpha-E domain-containing protein [Polaribacter sp. Q13]